MPIQKLEAATARVIGALQSLTDPASLIKELLDNALDAHATSIQIEISSNTLDLIQLRDNGHGIPLQDRGLVARPNCTSKITTAEDIMTIRGSSLGFRGQALASAAELSSTMSISTRIEGEEVASSLTIDRHGEVVATASASLPVGTLVKIEDFLSNNPVRRQVLLKAADKSLMTIKHMLQSYAFARPQTRLSYRVVKSKTEKHNFMYAPKSHATIQDVAVKLVGSACASECQWITAEHAQFALSAFLPRPNADIGKISGIGAFVSVDARPLSPKRGTLKEVITAFRGALQSSQSGDRSVKDPFLYLDICSSSLMYDPNIEPAKDDVLFEDGGGMLLEAAKQLFASVYPPDADSMIASEEGQNADPENLSQRMDLSREIMGETSSAEPVDCIERPIPNPVLERVEFYQPAVRNAMSANEVNEFDLCRGSSTPQNIRRDDDELREARRDVIATNPWALARLNAPLRETIACVRGDPEVRRMQDSLNGQRQSYQEPTTPQPSWSHSNPELVSNLLVTGRNSPHSYDHPDSNDNCSTRPMWVDGWSENSLSGLEMPGSRPSTRHELGGVGRVPYHTPPRSTPLTRSQGDPHLSRPSGFKHQRPFKAPSRRTEGDVPQLEFGPSALGANREGRTHSFRAQNTERSLVVRDEPTEEDVSTPFPLDRPINNRDIREFVRPGDDTVGGVRPPSSNRGGLSVQSTPLTTTEQENRAPAARTVMNRHSTNFDHGSPRDGPEVPEQPHERRWERAPSVVEMDIEPGRDLVQRTSAEVQPPMRPMRRKSSRLPLERIPRGKATHNVTVKLKTCTKQICKLSKGFNQDCLGLDFSVDASTDAQDGLATMPPPSELRVMADSLRKLILRQQPNAELVQDLESLLSDVLMQQFQPSQSVASEDILLV